MKIEKKHLAQLNRCYATGSVICGGRRLALLATEGEGPCYAYSGEDFTRQEVVWQGPGGTMSFVPLPETNGEFLSNQKFFRMFQWEEATIVWVRPQPDGTFIVRDLFVLPYIHRFDVLQAGDRRYFIGCTLATKKESKEDWSSPGKIYVAELPDDLNEPMKLVVLKDGLTQNHGYSRVIWNGRMAAMIGCREGAYVVAPPVEPGAAWTVEQIMDWPVSDLAAIDIDGDGQLEIATIEPFHGSYFRVWKKDGPNWRKIFEHPEVSEFYHVVVAAELRGKPVFIGGCRRGRMQLFYVEARTLAPLVLAPVLIDEDVGPSNVSVIHEDSRDVIVAANREKGEAALYFCRD